MKPIKPPSKFYQAAILVAALILIATSITDAVIDIIDLVEGNIPGQDGILNFTLLRSIGQLVGGIVLMGLLVYERGATAKAERKAAAADERAAVALRRLDEAIESIDQGFALFDSQDRLIRCNSRFRQLYGITGPFDNGTTFENLVRLAAQNGQYADCNKDNTEQWVRQRVEQHRNAISPLEQQLSDGTWLRIDERKTSDGNNVGLRTDITELKRRESEIAAKTAMLEATLGAMVQGVLVWNADGELITYNRRVQELLELPESLLSQPLTLAGLLEFLTDRGEFGSDHGWSRQALVSQLLQTVKNPNGSRYERQRPNGKILEIRTTHIPGGLTMITYTDITEQRHADIQLRESEERFRKLSDSAMEGIIAHENGIIIDANRAAGDLMKIPADQMIGVRLLDFIALEFHDMVRNRLAHREESRLEMTCIRHDGVRVLIESENRYVQHRGRYVSMVSFRDITEQRQAEAVMRQAKEAAENASRTKNDFIRTVSHELRTPMNGVLGMLELLTEGELDEPLRTFAKTAYTSAESLLGLLDDLLDLSKIEAGRLSLDRLTFDAAHVVTMATDIVAARAAAKGLSLVIAIPPDLGSLMTGDPARLRQILLNLIGNAIKFTNSGGIVITLDQAPADEVGEDGCNALRFEVRDTGIGIAPEAQSRLFDDFVQVHSGVQTGGSGLGLAICRRLVELMGGKIGVDSAAGQGSRFWFILPCRSDPAPVPAGDQPAKNENVPSRPCCGRSSEQFAAPLSAYKIAVISETPLIRSALTRQISAWGADTSPCATVEEARALLETDAGRLSALLAQGGMNPVGSMQAGIAAVVWRHGGEISACIIHPVGTAPWPGTGPATPFNASLPAPPPRTAVLEWPVHPDQVFAVLTGQPPTSTPATAPAIFPAAVALPPQLVFAADPPRNLGRVLLAEDGETNRMVAGTFLEKAGYDVVYALNGREAVEAIQGMPFDIILMDVGMPELDGLAATRAIRALPPPAGETPIIAMTADALESDRERCLEAGMNDHISKPLERALLLQTVGRWSSGGGSGRPLDLDGGADGTASGTPPDDATDALDSATLAQLECDLDRDMLSGLIRQFLDETAVRIDRMLACVNDHEALRREAHTLKSTAGTFGALRLNKAARDIELSCAAPDADVSVLCRQLPAMLASAESALRRSGHVT